ncbi:hypothetical protein PSEUDO8AS_100355 [Pseudomonas sp. 8AS]|uniref:transposase n=1 Tax=Pseudomonas sp. 8AS TaxID=2653163 RepID=UPI0012F1279B|nr:transposase [Pseudomonas sp. 8AS]VXB48374.1 hypothetical protein PSEUDO8AS_100355 [Pseudomonas sp. 8AS]
MLQRVEEQIAETLNAIRKSIDDDPGLRGKRDLLTRIDGIGERTAALLLAELGDPLHFERARAITAFAGLNPKLQDSGTHKGQVRISRAGSARLRAGLYMPAVNDPQHSDQCPGEAPESPRQGWQTNRLRSHAQAAAYPLRRIEVGSAIWPSAGPCSGLGIRTGA